MPDGSVVISTALDNQELEKQLQGIKKKIGALKEQLMKAEQERSPILAQLAEMEMKLRQASEEAERFGREWSGGALGADRLQMEAQERLAALEKQNDLLLEKARGYDNAIAQAARELERQEIAAGELTKELAQAATQGSRMGEAVDQAGVYLGRFTKRIKDLARRVFIFTVITMALRSLRTWLGKVVRTNGEASRAVAQLRGALLTLAQPLVAVVIPAFTLLVKLLTRLASVAAQLFARLFGWNISDAKRAAAGLYQETEAMDALGDSAKDARKALAGFDELNILPGKEESGGSVQDNAPDFNFDAGLSEDQLDNIFQLVKAVAAGLLAWKLADSLVDGLQKFAGLFLALDGGIGLARAAMEAWTEGATWDNFLAMLGRGAELTAGLALAFGKAGAGVGLVITGLTLLATAFHDAAENGWNLQNTLMAIAGLIAAGLGIALLTGSWIPLLVAGIAALLLAVANACGNGEALIAGLKEILTGFLDFFTGVFTGDFKGALKGLQEMFKGAWNVILICFESAVNLIIKGLNWLIEKMNSIRFDVPDWMPGWGGKSFHLNIPSVSEVHLPRLATGTVVPPNRQFMAVLGDNKEEPEIVSPISAMKEAFLAALKESGGNTGPGGKVTLVLDGRVLGEFAIGYINGVTEQTGVCPVFV